MMTEDVAHPNISKVKVDTHRDGGTVCISENGVVFCIDNRIGTHTKHTLYNNYPTKGQIVYTIEDIDLFLNMVRRIDCDVSESEFNLINGAVIMTTSIKESVDKYEICKVIQKRLDDTTSILYELDVGHPDESDLIIYAKSLNELKSDLRMRKMWFIIR